MSGHFITFEGGEGAGKSSLIISLHAALIKRGLDIIQTRAPGGTNPGKAMRDLLLHPTDPVVPKAELFLYLADRADHVQKVIYPALQEGKIVLCDRFNDSTIAYQGGGRGFGLETIKKFCHFASDGLTPNLTIYLNIDPEVGLERVKQAMGHKDQIEAQALTFHKKIQSSFHKLASQEPHRLKIIDGSKPREEVFAQALKLIDAHCLAPQS